MNKTVLTIGIIFLLIGASVVSSTDNIKEEIQVKHQPLEPVDNPKVMSACNHLAYIGGYEGDCTIYEFGLNDPGNLLNCICGGIGGYFFSSIAWAPNGKLYGCEYNSGGLWVIDLEDCSMVNIGGGGTSCNSLAWNPVENRLYGTSGTALYEYNPETGEQDLIGSHGVSNTMIALAINSEGECYAFDVLFSGDSTLFTIDLETGQAYEVGSLGMNLLYAQDGDFCKEDDILYIAANAGGESSLFECDVDTGSCTLVGEFHEYAVVSMFTIPYNSPPVTTISFDPPYPNGENGWYVSNVTATLNATDYDGVYRTFYRINGGDWEIYESPFIISEKGEDILIEYYSLDNMGNFEDIKSATLDIDKTPPEMTVEWDVEKIGWRKWRVTFTINYTDYISGIDRLEIFLNDGLQSVVTGPGPTYDWDLIIYGGVSFSFKFIAYDIAGNQAIVVVNDTDISSNTYDKDIFTQQYPNPLILRLLERFPLLVSFLNSIQGGRV